MSNRETTQNTFTIPKKNHRSKTKVEKTEAIYRHSQYMNTIEEYEIKEAIKTMKSIFLKRDQK